MLEVIAVSALIGAIIFAVRMHSLDSVLHAHRDPANDSMLYGFIPLRWREDLYLPAGAKVVRACWTAAAGMIGCFGLFIVVSFFAS